MDAVVKTYLDSSDTEQGVHELELRITAFGEPVSRHNYNTVVRVLSGAGFKQTESTKLLRIAVGDNVRAEMEGLLTIQRYCETDALDAAKLIRKTRVKTHTNPNFGLKTSLSLEAPLSDENDRDLRNAWRTESKRFRFIHRIRMVSPEYPLAVDLSIVKMSDTQAVRFATSDVFSSPDVCEIEVEALERAKDLKSVLSKVATLILGGIQSTPFPIGAEEMSAVIASYTKLVGADTSKPPAQRFIGPNTVTLQHTNLTRTARTTKVLTEEDELSYEDNPYSIHSNYVVTDKADGLRKMLYVAPTGKVYFLTQKLAVEYAGCSCDAMKQSLIDGEFVELDADGKPLNLFAAFDAYVYKGKDVRSQKFKPRNDVLGEIVRALEPVFKFKICAKAYFSSKTSIFEACRACLHALVPYHTDGLIFTPAEYGVGLSDTVRDLARSTMTWDMNFKWKPLEQNTIDFKVQKKDGMLELRITGNAQNWDDPFKAILLQTDACPRSKKGLRLFVTEEDPTSYLTTVADMKTEEGDPIEDGMVVECRYDVTKPPYYRWIPQRVRWDKDMPNAFATAVNNFQTIQRPITRGMISGQEALDNREYYVGNKTAMKAIRQFHGWVKGLVLRQVCKPGANLIDFAVGMAGDLHKWRELRLNFVFGIDLSRDNIHSQRDGACIRYLSSTRVNHQLMCIFVVGDATKDVKSGQAFDGLDRSVAVSVLGPSVHKDAQMYPNVVSHMRSQFQVASMMFAIHYVFESRRTLLQFIKNVSDHLQIGGFFVGTTWDGEKVFEALRETDIDGLVTLGDVSIVKRFDAEEFAGDETSLGYAIDVSQSTFNENREYLVHFGYFEALMLRCGFAVAQFDKFDGIGSFQEVYPTYQAKNPPLDAKEQKLSFLNKYFIFRKTANVDISLDSEFKVELHGRMLVR